MQWVEFSVHKHNSKLMLIAMNITGVEHLHNEKIYLGKPAAASAKTLGEATLIKMLPVWKPGLRSSHGNSMPCSAINFAAVGANKTVLDIAPTGVRHPARPLGDEHCRQTTGLA